MPPKSTTKTNSKADKAAQRKAARTPPPGWKDPLAQQQPLVSGRWLFSAIFMVVGFAAVFAYLTLCLLFYQGQWQVVFHPSRTVAATPESVGLKYDDVRFDYTGTGLPQLAGWWIPAETDHAAQTLLFLHDGRGSLADTVPQLRILHSLGINLFAFDYRGFGKSSNDHPSETRVYEDADAAWAYLTDIRHVDPKSITLYGAGLGATIAAESALRHRESGGLILENPAPPALTLIEADARTNLLPTRWLFRDRFELAPKLKALGVELSPATDQIVSTGKLASSPIVFRQEKPGLRKPDFLLLLGPTPYNDSNYLPSLAEFLARLNQTPSAKSR
jgi:pimeloyl-ACP methyl ester carboxylesterase